MKWILPLLISTFFCLSFGHQAQAAERRLFYEGARGRAMGGAQIAVTNDETALLVNPAGLGKLRDFYGTIIDPEIDMTANFYKMNKESAITEPFTVAGIKDSLNATRDTYYHAKAQVFPSLVARNFGIGFYASNLLDGEMNTAGTQMNIFARNDLAFALGYNFRFFDGRIKLGFSAKVLNRIETINTAVNPNGNLDGVTLGEAEGTGISNDVGLIMTAPWTLLPTISAVVHDVGGTTFNQASGVRKTTANQPVAVPQDMDVAFAIFPIHSNKVRSTFTVEYRGLLTSAQELDKAKLLHVGTEVNIGDILFLRMGYNQRYMTGGIEVASERLQFQLTSYGEEVGDQITPREDRRTMFKAAFRF
jgi:hypothetical protein